MPRRVSHRPIHAAATTTAISVSTPNPAATLIPSPIPTRAPAQVFTSPTTSKSPINFLNLPLQIRQRIYTHLTRLPLRTTRETGGGSNLILGRREWHKRLTVAISHPPLSLLSTNRQTRAEYATTLLSTGIIFISILRSSWEETPFVALRLPMIEIREVIWDGRVDSCFRAGLVVNRDDFGARVRLISRLMASEWERGVRWQGLMVQFTHLVDVEQIVESRLCRVDLLREKHEDVKESLKGITLLTDEEHRNRAGMRVVVHLGVDASKGAEGPGGSIASFALDASGDETKVVQWKYSYLEAIEARKEEPRRPLDFLAKVDVMEPWVRDTGPS